MGSKGIVASTAGMAVLLQEGIGDTIRVSLTPEPGGDRTQEVIVAQEILQTMGLRSFTPMVVACPGLRAHDEHLLPGARAEDPVAHPPPHARVAHALRGRRGHDGRGDGLRRERSGREQAREHRHQPAGHRRAAGRAGLRRRREDRDAQGRAHRRGIPGARRALRRAQVRAQKEMQHDGRTSARAERTQVRSLRGRRRRRSRGAEAERCLAKLAPAGRSRPMPRTSSASSSSRISTAR